MRRVTTTTVDVTLEVDRVKELANVYGGMDLKDVMRLDDKTVKFTFTQSQVEGV